MQGNKILLVTGDEAVRQSIKPFLQAQGFDVMLSTRHEEIPVIVYDFQPDFLIVDIAEENVFGLLQGRSQITHAKLVMLVDKPLEMANPVWPADRYLQKPVRQEDIQKAIDDLREQVK